MSRLILYLVIAVSVFAQVPQGATKQQVIEALGWPGSSSVAGEREILNYPEYSILLVNGRVEKLERKPAAQKTPVQSRPKTDKPVSPASQKPATAENRLPAPADLLRPSRDRQDTRPQLKTEPDRQISPVNQQAGARPKSESTHAAVPRPAASDPFAPVRNTVIVMVLLFAALMGSKWWLRAQASRRRDDRFLGPDLPKESAESPLLQLSRPMAKPRPDPVKDGWTLELLRSIEWHRFEHLVAAYEREMGHNAELTSFGADGGIDIELFPPGSRTPSRIIQCKAYVQQNVGVEPVRAFYGVMQLRKVPQGSFYTTGSFSSEAIEIGRGTDNLELVDGPTFLNRIQRLHPPVQTRLFEVATEGEYTTPTCASCGVKMILKTAEKGRAAGRRFWGCRNYPRCRSVLNIAQT